MAKPHEIEAQVKLEREAIQQGLKNLRENTQRLENKEYASASVYGCASIDTILPDVIQRIKDTHYRIKKGDVGRSFVEIKKYLADVEPEVAAVLALKLTFDKVFSPKDDANLTTNVCEAVGRAVEDECQMRHYERSAPGLLHTIKKNYEHNAQGTRQKLTVIQTMMSRYGVEEWKRWKRTDVIKLGAWLVDCVLSVSNWFTKEIKIIRGKKDSRLVPTPEFISIKDQLMYNAELFSPMAWVMLIPPNDWTNERPGGYLLNEVMRGHDMVRRGASCIQGEKPIEFLNKIQKVGYRVNPFVHKVAQELEARGIQVGKFVPIVHHELPPKPADIADNYDSRLAYRRDCADKMNKNAASFKKSCRTRMTMDSAKRFKDVEFFIPWSFDYRGRIYPIPAFLTPQDTDFGKSLIKFSNESWMTPEAEGWLAFQVATTYGLDKAPMKERMQWVQDNVTYIKAVATDPLGNLSMWESVDEPWQFLAACDEYYHCVIECDRHTTSLMVAVDATCSGLQILAGLARDASTARLVNVLPGDKPQDAYKVVADDSRPHIPARFRGEDTWSRKTTKRVVMTVPYNAKPFSNRGYIREALKEVGVEDVTKEELTELVKETRASLNRIVPGPMKVMKWIESEVAKAIKRGEEHIEWTTPSGFVVHQKFNKKLFERITLQLMGRVNIRVATDDSDVVDINHHKNATSPNLIHSLDASILCFTGLKFDAPLSLIHDSVLCRATDMGSLSDIVREVYMHIFAEHDYLNDWAQQIGAETKPPIIGTLEPEDVMESTYFFC